MKEGTYFSITTPKGAGGISVIELFGNNALKIINKVFHPLKCNLHKESTSLRTYLQSNRLYLGHIYRNRRKIDEVIVHLIPAKHSFTKLDTIEINAHGGIMSCRIIGNILKMFGVKEISQEEVITLAYKIGGLNIIQKEALENLLKARTPLVAGVLLDQYGGVLSMALKSGKNLPELSKSSLYGLLLTHPKRILILGKPNVGKSTLFNSLIGKERAITHHLAGTTRDAIEEPIAIKGFPFILVDSAGLRMTRNNIEKEEIFYTKQEIAKADIILLVIDVNEIKLGATLNKLDYLNNIPVRLRRICRRHSVARRRPHPIIIVLNKIDQLKKSVRPACQSVSAGRLKILQNNRPIVALQGWHHTTKVVDISALKKIGIDKLREEICRIYGLERFTRRGGEPIIFTPRQYSLLKSKLFSHR